MIFEWSKKRHPLIKLSFILILITGTFFMSSPLINLLPWLIFSVFLLAIGRYKAALLLALSGILLTALAVLLLKNDSETAKSFGVLFETFTRVGFMVASASVFYMTTEVTDIIKSLEQIGVPSTIVIPLAVTLRFIPTLKEEFISIKDAMAIRSMPVGIKGLLHPLKQMEYILVPLLMRTARIADELTAASLTRGIKSLHKKTSYKDYSIKFGDIMLLLTGLAIVCIMLILNNKMH